MMELQAAGEAVPVVHMYMCTDLYAEQEGSETPAWKQHQG
jgi:hypothetical protein